MSGGGGGESPNNTDWRLNQTLCNVQGMLEGRSFPGKVLITQQSEPLPPPDYSSHFDCDEDEHNEGSQEGEGQSPGNSTDNTSENKSNVPSASITNSLPVAQGVVFGARATDSARITKFTKELSRPAVILDKLCEVSWSGVPPYMRPNIWRLLLGYSPPNKDRRDGVLTMKRHEYVEYVSQYYDIPDSERADEEINMLHQISVDCPRTVPDVTFFQNPQIQKSLERILYTWSIRHPASGYVQGINDLVTPFLYVFLSEHLEGNIDTWSMDNLLPQDISNIEADCYWCLSKFLDGMQDHYTFAQPGIQCLVFRLKELVRRIDEPLSKQIEEQGLEFLQFSFRWFSCLLIREVCVATFDFVLHVHIKTKLLTCHITLQHLIPPPQWSDKLQKLDFQEMVMFLQRLPTSTWAHHELEMVLSRAYMWHTMFKSAPSHLTS
ncbi:GTPase-activating protein gyp1 [Setaria italica]|uniref:GTPase-activating protein gyp1 n=1 Tax=Setaria italica TaxID=4555 RepID=UPI000350CF44|nr:GTPase-activating protein gyp1 [Setaria italica]